MCIFITLNAKWRHLIEHNNKYLLTSLAVVKEHGLIISTGMWIRVQDENTAIIRKGWQIIKTNKARDKCTERNKWYILTHLGESGYCLQINPNYQVNWPNCWKFSGQWPRSLWNPGRWKSQFTPSACYLIYCTIPLRSVGSNLDCDIAFSRKFVFFSIHITLLREDIYIYTVTHHVGYVCSVRIMIVL